MVTEDDDFEAEFQQFNKEEEEEDDEFYDDDDDEQEAAVEIDVNFFRDVSEMRGGATISHFIPPPLASLTADYMDCEFETNFLEFCDDDDEAAATDLKSVREVSDVRRGAIIFDFIPAAAASRRLTADYLWPGPKKSRRHQRMGMEDDFEAEFQEFNNEEEDEFYDDDDEEEEEEEAEKTDVKSVGVVSEKRGGAIISDFIPASRRLTADYLWPGPEKSGGHQRLEMEAQIQEFNDEAEEEEAQTDVNCVREMSEMVGVATISDLITAVEAMQVE